MKQRQKAIMLTRRRLLSGAALGGLAAFASARRAGAFTIEPMPAPVKKAYALACKSPSLGDHATLIAEAQSALKREIATGAAKSDAVEVVVCPICGCRFTVSADASF
jgi:hypothetical protein